VLALSRLRRDTKRINRERCASFIDTSCAGGQNLSSPSLPGFGELELPRPHSQAELHCHLVCANVSRLWILLLAGGVGYIMGQLTQSQALPSPLPTRHAPPRPCLVCGWMTRTFFRSPEKC